MLSILYHELDMVTDVPDTGGFPEFRTIDTKRVGSDLENV
jgi:hypothetical protein